MTNETQKTPFCERLEYLIGKSGDQKKVFAKNCGISEKQIFVYLNGKAKPGLNFFDGLKKHYPQVSIDWLVSGHGNPFIGSNEKPASFDDLLNEQLIKKFGDKDFALEINHALVALEKVSMKEFYKIGGYIKAVAEQGIEVRVDSNTPQVQQKEVTPWDGSERRSGDDRRKSVTE